MSLITCNYLSKDNLAALINVNDGRVLASLDCILPKAMSNTFSEMLIPSLAAAAIAAADGILLTMCGDLPKSVTYIQNIIATLTHG